MQPTSTLKCMVNKNEMKYLTLILLLSVLFSCQRHDSNENKSIDSLSIISASLSDSSLNFDYLNSYRKKSIPISVKPMSNLKSYEKGYYHNDYSDGNYTLKDTLFIFSEIKSYTGATSRVNLNVPSEGVQAHFYIIKIKDKWTIVKDSTSMYET